MKIMHEITILNHRLHRLQNEYIAPLGLSGAHGRLLLRIAEKPGISQDELAQKAYVDKSSIARHMAAMEEQGLVCRKTDPANRRVLCIYPTERGQEIIPKLQKAVKEWESVVFQDLSSWELSQLLSLLTRVRQGVGEAD